MIFFFTDYITDKMLLNGVITLFAIITGPYDFHDTENVDEIVEFSHKNDCIMQNFTELVIF